MSTTPRWCDAAQMASRNRLQTVAVLALLTLLIPLALLVASRSVDDPPGRPAAALTSHGCRVTPQ